MKFFKSRGGFIVSIGLLLGLIFMLMQLTHYRWVVMNNTFELYAILVAIIFTGIGIWAGKQFMKPKTKLVEKVVEKEVYVSETSTFDRTKFIENTGLSERELEVLELIVEGKSNQEIADGLFLSLSTVKTHISNIFLKLGVSRRTQAVQKAKEQGMPV